jgi:hypothetical protein
MAERRQAPAAAALLTENPGQGVHAEAVNVPNSAIKATRLIALPGHPCKRLPFSPTFITNRKSNSRK